MVTKALDLALEAEQGNLLVCRKICTRYMNVGLLDYYYFTPYRYAYNLSIIARLRYKFSQNQRIAGSLAP